MRNSFIVLLLIPFGLWAQHTVDHDVVKGIVVEDFGDSLSPIPGAQLRWLGADRRTVTDNEGKFEIDHTALSPN